MGCTPPPPSPTDTHIPPDRHAHTHARTHTHTLIHTYTRTHTHTHRLRGVHSFPCRVSLRCDLPRVVYAALRFLNAVQRFTADLDARARGLAHVADALQLVRRHRLMDSYAESALAACDIRGRARATSALVRLRVGRLHLGMGRWLRAAKLLEEALARFQQMSDGRQADLARYYLQLIRALRASPSGDDSSASSASSHQESLFTPIELSARRRRDRQMQGMALGADSAALLQVHPTPASPHAPRALAPCPSRTSRRTRLASHLRSPSMIECSCAATLRSAARPPRSARRRISSRSCTRSRALPRRWEARSTSPPRSTITPCWRSSDCDVPSSAHASRWAPVPDEHPLHSSFGRSRIKTQIAFTSRPPPWPAPLTLPREPHLGERAAPASVGGRRLVGYSR